MYINLRTGDGIHFVSAENGGGGQVDATRTSAAQWETWEIAEISGLLQITNGARVHLRTYDRAHFLCAENGGGGQVDATRTSAAQWETFTVVYAPGQSGPLNTGTQFSLLCYDGDRYLCAEGGGGGAIDATRSAAGPWETFTAIRQGGVPTGTYVLQDEATGFVLDSNASKNVYTGSPNGGAYQKWQFEDLGNGYTLIRDDATGFVLDSNTSMNVYTNDYNGGAYQHWQLQDGGNGYTILRNEATGFVLDSNGNMNVYTNSYNGGAFQKWKLVPVQA
jgi:ricin-type beta-trefoil lectin protein